MRTVGIEREEGYCEYRGALVAEHVGVGVGARVVPPSAAAVAPSARQLKLANVNVAVVFLKMDGRFRSEPSPAPVLESTRINAKFVFFMISNDAPPPPWRAAAAAGGGGRRAAGGGGRFRRDMLRGPENRRSRGDNVRGGAGRAQGGRGEGGGRGPCARHDLLPLRRYNPISALMTALSTDKP
ncbi:hypothetical protein EVAR_20823_1 [Eumeta japonica]|uniref:Uncharacterized protein n=1 Tax=Eumeta variegata TaxID=151549 RepID=A0A4C1UDS8_EUMVA|nr:hypothetical protein EVAR_20823_1 [Eumeta japonica]